MPDPSVAHFTYRAFISYSHRDKAWADWLHKALETYRVPSRLVGTTTAHGKIPRRLNPVFRDRDELSSSPELGTRINQALAQSENLIVICSPAAAASRWVNEEVLAWKRMGRAARIFCLIVDGEPDATDLPGHEAEECFCPALRFVSDADGRPTNERTEPIAADGRPGKDGKPNAKLKLIAGMLDVGFDALKQREQRRQVQRMTAIAGIALVVMAVTIVLAIAALVSRHRAVIAQHEAVVAKQAAVRRQKQAEGLVGFMLGDLNDKLQQVSRLDIMQSVDDKAMAYFASMPATDVNDAALTQRAKALEEIGSVRMGQGELPGALAAFGASTRISSRLAAAAPHDVARQVAYSRTLAYIGMAYWDQGKLSEAQRNFEAARDALQPALAHTPGDLPLLQQVTFVDDDLDHVLAAQGQLAKASGAAREWLRLDETLIKIKPEDTDYESDLGDAHNELGRLALLQGELAMALGEYHADDSIETQLSARDPRNNDQRENVLRSRAILGRTLALAGNSPSGMQALQQALAVGDTLLKLDPTQTDWQNDVALRSMELARLQRFDGNVSGAGTLISSAITRLTRLIHKDPSNAGWQRNYAAALTEQAAQSRAEGHLPAARAQIQSALVILEPMLDKHPDERDTVLAAITAKLLQADVTADPAAARALRETALKALQAQKTGRDDPRLLALQVRALLALDRKADAQAFIKPLWTSGYRDAGFVKVLQRAGIAYPTNPDFQARLTATATAAGSTAQAGDTKHP